MVTELPNPPEQTQARAWLKQCYLALRVQKHLDDTAAVRAILDLLQNHRDKLPPEAPPAATPAHVLRMWEALDRWTEAFTETAGRSGTHVTNDEMAASEPPLTMGANAASGQVLPTERVLAGGGDLTTGAGTASGKNRMDGSALADALRAAGFQPGASVDADARGRSDARLGMGERTTDGDRTHHGDDPQAVDDAADEADDDATDDLSARRGAASTLTERLTVAQARRAEAEARRLEVSDLVSRAYTTATKDQANAAAFDRYAKAAKLLDALVRHEAELAAQCATLERELSEAGYWDGRLGVVLGDLYGEYRGYGPQYRYLCQALAGVITQREKLEARGEADLDDGKPYLDVVRQQAQLTNQLQKYTESQKSDVQTNEHVNAALTRLMAVFEQVIAPEAPALWTRVVATLERELAANAAE